MFNLKFSYIDLFSGIGGFRLAIDKLGGKCLGFSEVNSDAINTYCENFGENYSTNFGDITKIKKIPYCNLLTAGVPCQSWSIAGHNLGFDDDRGQLWNDTLYILKESKPEVFIFENVKGLVDPRNNDALIYIKNRIKEAGYFSDTFVINSYDYGVPQNRIRVFFIGFKNEKFFHKFRISPPVSKNKKLKEILNDLGLETVSKEENKELDLFGNKIEKRTFSLSTTNGINDYFLFNDLRDGATTIHSWEIKNINQKLKKICELLLKNRRKSKYGPLDGNPLSLSHFQELNSEIKQEDLNYLIEENILKREEYLFKISRASNLDELNENEKLLLNHLNGNILNVDILKSNKELKKKKISISETISNLVEKEIINCIEVRYDFKNTKISTGLFGVNRIFLPTSNIFPTLVASDTNDYVTNINLELNENQDIKTEFLEKIYYPKKYRKITREEACLIQGFPENFKLPESRSKWMKLIGNSVSVPVIEMLIKEIINTGALDTKKIKQAV